VFAVFLRLAGPFGLSLPSPGTGESFVGINRPFDLYTALPPIKGLSSYDQTPAVPDRHAPGETRVAGAS